MEDDIVLEPPLYFAEDHIWDISFHPHQDVLACSLITGAVQILKYNSDSVDPVLRLTELHKQSVRTLLATGGKDKRLGFVDTNGSIVHIQKKAHDDSISKVFFMNNQNLVSGDDSGVVKIWDLRFSTCVFQASEQSEGISGFAYSQKDSFLLSSSLDGTLAVYDLRKGGIQHSTAEQQSKALYALSDCMEQDLLGVEIVKDGKFVACNSSEGVILLFKWDWFGDCKDRIQGHPNTIDAMIKLNENTLITGSEDGFVRGVGIHPNKIIQVLGQHEEDEHFPIQRLDISHCRKILASCSHDNSIKFYDVNDFVKKRDSKQAKELSEDEAVIEEESNQPKIQKIKEEKDSDDNEDDSDSSDSSDGEMQAEKSKKKKKKKNKTNMKKRQGEMARQKRSKFFKEM